MLTHVMVVANGYLYNILIVFFYDTAACKRGVRFVTYYYSKGCLVAAVGAFGTYHL